MRRRRISFASITEQRMDLSVQTYMFEDLCNGVFTYIEDRYRGSFRIEPGCSLSGDVRICKDALCYCIRLLLNELFGRTLLYVSYGTSVDNAFYLSFTYDVNTPISEKARLDLLVYAKYAKVSFDYIEKDGCATIYLLMPIVKSSIECVYEPKPFNLFLYALHDIELPEKIDREAVHPDGAIWYTAEEMARRRNRT